MDFKKPLLVPLIAISFGSNANISISESVQLTFTTSPQEVVCGIVIDNSNGEMRFQDQPLTEDNKLDIAVLGMGYTEMTKDSIILQDNNVGHNASWTAKLSSDKYNFDYIDLDGGTIGSGTNGNLNDVDDLYITTMAEVNSLSTSEQTMFTGKLTLTQSCN